MQVLVPHRITDAMLVSCTIPENDHPAWSAATAYTVGADVILTTTHKRYRATSASTGKSPDAHPDLWQDRGATNRWAMFDAKVGTVSEAPEGFTVTLQPGLSNAIALVGADVGDVEVTVEDPVYGQLFHGTYNMKKPPSMTSHWTWFFEPRQRKTILIVRNLPTTRTSQITITTTVPDGQTARLGSLLVGNLNVYDESVLAGASLGIRDFGRKERDDFGNWQIVERTWSKRANWRFLMHNKDLERFFAQMADIRSRPALFIGGRYEATVIYGFWIDADVVIEYPAHSECTIEIEGLEEK